MYNSAHIYKAPMTIILCCHGLCSDYFLKLFYKGPFSYKKIVTNSAKGNLGAIQRVYQMML